LIIRYLITRGDGDVEAFTRHWKREDHTMAVYDNGGEGMRSAVRARIMPEPE